MGAFIKTDFIFTVRCPHSKMSQVYSENIVNAHPRIGLPWTTDEEKQLLDLLSRGVNREDIATAHQRTLGGIVGRINYIAVKMARSGASMESICKTTRLTPEQVEQELVKFSQKKIEKMGKAQVTPPPKEETVLSVMKEMRDLLRVLVQKL